MAEEKEKKESPVATAAKPAKPAEAAKTKEQSDKLIRSLVTFITVLAGAILLLAYPFTLANGDSIGVLFFLLGLLWLISSYYIFKVEYWSWGSVLMTLVLVFVLVALKLVFTQGSIPAGILIVMGYGVALAVILFFVRRTYGVGVWKIQQAEEEKKNKEREAVRTANAEGLRCPKCRSTDLYMCEDGSTFCRNCKAGFVDIRNASAKPASSVQF